MGDFGQTIDHYITYSVISAQPELTYSSVYSTVRCFAITSGKHEGHTYVQWSGSFSSDADAGMISPLLFVVCSFSVNDECSLKISRCHCRCPIQAS